MSVVNVKVGHIRPEYDNLKEWMEDPKNVYVGRKGIVFITMEDGKKERFPKNDSVFCNPFKVGKDGTLEDHRQMCSDYPNIPVNVKEFKDLYEAGKISSHPNDSFEVRWGKDGNPTSCQQYYQ